MSKMASDFSEKKKADGLAHNPEQMRISTDAAVFQPIVRVDVPQFNGLQTPLVGSSGLRGSNSVKSINLPRFTPIKVLSNNGRYALVELKNKQRGFVPSPCIASESSILATAKPAAPVHPLYSNTTPIDPTTGLPYDPQALYVPKLDAGDAPVDQAMLNNIDSIPLPESEKHPAPQAPEAQYVDDVVLRNASEKTEEKASDKAVEKPTPSN